MSDQNQEKLDTQQPPVTGTQQGFDYQATGLVDVTFAETLGLSMHNAVTTQLNAQMAASSSTTSACSRILGSEPATVAASKVKSAPSKPSLFSRMLGTK